MDVEMDKLAHSLQLIARMVKAQGIRLKANKLGTTYLVP
jgi:hypothetical protein